MSDIEPSSTQEKSIEFYDKRGHTASAIWAKIINDGDFVLYRYDYGEFTEEYFGGDYEMWASVKPNDKDDLLLAFAEELYSGNGQALATFEMFCKSKGIKCHTVHWSG